jgi:beta-galactosidase
VESYTGRFDEVFATRSNDEVVGFIQTMGKGQVLMFGAAVPAYNLDDLDLVHQMALKMDCQPLFKLSQWADVRLSRSEKGSFLFINNYLDDPVETIIEYENETLFGGHAIRLPARRGYILPLDWQLNEDVLIHYATAEISQVTQDKSTLILKTDPAEFTAEFTLADYTCDGAKAVSAAEPNRVRVEGRDGQIVLRKPEV